MAQHRLPFLRIAPHRAASPHRAAAAPLTSSVGTGSALLNHPHPVLHDLPHPETVRNPRFARLRWKDSWFLQCCFVCTSGSRDWWEPFIDNEHLDLKDGRSIYDVTDKKNGKSYEHGERWNVWVHAIGSAVMFVYLSWRLFAFEAELGRLPYTETIHFLAIGTTSLTLSVSAFYHAYTPYRVCGAWMRIVDWTFVYAALCLTLVAEVAIATFDSQEAYRTEAFDSRPTTLDAILPSVFTTLFFLANRFVALEAETWLPRGVLDAQGGLNDDASRRMYHNIGMLSSTRVVTSLLFVCGYLLVVGRMLVVDLTPTSRDAQTASIVINATGILLVVLTQGLEYIGFPDDMRAGALSRPWLYGLLKALPDAHVTWHIISFLYALACTLSREWLLCYLRQSQDSLFNAPGESDPFGSWCNRTAPL